LKQAALEKLIAAPTLQRGADPGKMIVGFGELKQKEDISWRRATLKDLISQIQRWIGTRF
jgi:hypothetical protein